METTNVSVKEVKMEKGYYVGQILQSRTGTQYKVQKDGSWRRITAKKSKKRAKKDMI